ncbi:MAG: hypothetical protein WCW52_01390 [Elusimicrobiales bacterium]|jgi:hypothetical protein
MKLSDYVVDFIVKEDVHHDFVLVAMLLVFTWFVWRYVKTAVSKIDAEGAYLKTIALAFLTVLICQDCRDKHPAIAGFRGRA